MTRWTTLVGLVRTRWHRSVAIADPSFSVFQVERTISRVPAEYMSLHTYLEHRYASTVVLTFEQTEALLGFALPASARTEREWWTVGAARTNRHSEAWLGAGRTAVPNLPAQTVTFERVP